MTLAARIRGLVTRRYVPTLLLSLAAGLVVFLTARGLFPYHSLNHDEGVYMQQAALLLEGQVQHYPPPALADEFRPWFFVVEDGTMYPKYAPVPAGMFALGLAVGLPRLALAAIAVGNVALVMALGTEAFDRRVGVLSGVVLALSPMFLLASSLFLPYAPTTFLNLLFALGYVRAVRASEATTSRRWAGLAGVAIALAFFARPYTAVLFALPFIGHACWTLWTGYRHEAGRLRPHLARNLVVAVLGILGVATALGYNWLLTGDPLLFPFEAFAPLDGLGFGRRRIVDHELVWTPALALRANVALLRQFATTWTAAGWVGSVVFAVGVVAWAAHLRGSDASPTFDRPHLSDDALRLLVLGVFVSVAVGNIYFWGSYNVQGGLEEAHDGLMAIHGPIYHFDMLLPLSVFGGFGVLRTGEVLRDRVASRYSPRAARVALVVALVLTVPVVGVAEQAALSQPVRTSADYTEKYEQAYEPLESTDFDDALVFVPTAYGPWSNHPFQSLRNDPGFDGDVVYAQHQDAESVYEVVDHYRDRNLYRWTYHGVWTPDETERVTGKLVPLDVREGERLRGTTRMGIPPGVDSAIVRIEGEDEVHEYYLNDSVGENVTVNWTVGPGSLRVTDDDLRPLGESGPVAFDGAEELAVAVVLNYDGGATLTYRQEFDTRARGGTVEVLWPAETSVCSLTVDCGTEGTYLPDHPDEHIDGVWINGTLTATGRDG
ncbi:ArnT family glycosyltransferase [Haloarchaeobius amylolyticus]|uniref:ArnT family glycosyltransferase n=1 Tax=Haloarchaeobius amylolyticus TaxID=1198296 RepID=UPI00226E976F|nr:phospholipid carrier-dependent glycosyltransferase [Haloarchaeobius amylolyticus]